MKTILQFPSMSRRTLAALVLMASFFLSGNISLKADGVVSDCTQQALEDAIATGGEVTFAEDCDITITNTIKFTLSTTLDAAGHDVTIRSLFSAVAATFTNVTVATNIITTTNLSNCGTNINCFTNEFGQFNCTTNIACTTNINSVTNVSFTTNIINTTLFTNGVRLFEVTGDAEVSFTSIKFDSGRSAFGGALFVGANATAILTDCTFTNNHAIGTNGVPGFDQPDDTSYGNNGTKGSNGEVARGGAIYNLGDLQIFGTTFQGNHAFGGNGGRGGKGGNGTFQPGNGGDGGTAAAGVGGAIYNGGTLRIEDSTMEDNSVVGGNGGIGGTNGTGPLLALSGIGGMGGAGSGAGIYSTQRVVAINCTFANNLAEGGDSTKAGSQSGNGVNGTKGGNSFGGGLCVVSGNGGVTNSTFFGNQVKGGNGGDGGDGGYNAGNGGDGGDGSGGGLYNSGSFNILNCTFLNGRAAGGTNGLAGAGAFAGSNGNKGNSRGGNIANVGTRLWLKNTIIGANLGGGGGYGTIIDAGYNLKPKSDTSLTFTSSFSKTSTNLHLGTLADNGGPTQTILPQAGSPAINAGDDAVAPDTDQRGFPRPVGPQSDIGSVEGGIPTITSNPQSQTKSVGSSVTFSVGATGGSLSYAWRFSGVNVAGATSANYTINNLTTNRSGPYSVVVSNAFGAVTSAVATLTVVATPSITTQPTNVTVMQNSAASFLVGASGGAPLSYQWQLNGANISGATNSVFSLLSAQATNAGNYTAVVTNSAGTATSQIAILKVLSSPNLTQPSTTQTNFNFTFQSTLGSTYVIQYKNDLTDPIWIPIATNTGTGGVISYVDSTTNGHRFYRIVVN